jgi:hypothetical protein
VTDEAPLQLPDGQGSAAPDPARHARRLAFLHGLAEAGMAMARRLCDQARRGLVSRERGAAAGLAETFARVSKAIRLAILLRQRLAAAGPGALMSALAAAVRIRRRADPVGTVPPAERPAERRDSETDPWLDRTDDAELRRRTAPALVRRLCAILGVTHDPALWTDPSVEGHPPGPAPAPPPASRPIDDGPTAPSPGPWRYPPRPASRLSRSALRASVAPAPLPLSLAAAPRPSG